MELKCSKNLKQIKRPVLTNAKLGGEGNKGSSAKNGCDLVAKPFGVFKIDFKMILYFFIINILYFSNSLCQDLLDGNHFSFDLFDAKVDSTLDNSIRKNFDDDDGSISLKSISVDLNYDGIDEKLIPNEFLCGSGGCPWLIYSLNLNKVIGNIFGNVLYIEAKQKNNYHIIHTYSRNGGGKGTLIFYEYSKGRYVSVERVDLKNEQIKDYFENKKNLKK